MKGLACRYSFILRVPSLKRFGNPAVWCSLAFIVCFCSHKNEGAVSPQLLMAVFSMSCIKGAFEISSFMCQVMYLLHFCPGCT